MSWSPQPDDYANAIMAQNPWRLSGTVPSNMVPKVRRPLANHLWRAVQRADIRRFQLVIGPRRVGKTVAMYQAVQSLIKENVDPKRLWWLHLAHPLLMEFSLDRLVQLVLQLSQGTTDESIFLFLDELTYADKWDLWLKSFYDQQLPVRIIGTSSAVAALRHQRAESGVGRWEEQHLLPCTFPEYLELQGDPVAVQPASSFAETLATCNADSLDLGALKVKRDRYLLTGGFPELIVAAQTSGRDGHLSKLLFPDAVIDAVDVFRSQRVLRDDAIQKAIYQDIPQVFGVQSPVKLERLLYTLAGQVGGIVSYKTLATDVGLGVPTIENYIRYLERSFLIFLLPNYCGNEEAIQRRGRKLYFLDSAVRNAALQRGNAPLHDPREMGCLIENTAAAHLFSLSMQTDVRLFHWREKGVEVDLIYDHPFEPMAFEISASESHSYRGLAALQERHPRFRGRCYFVSPNPIVRQPSPDGVVGMLPLDAFLLAVGAQASKAIGDRLHAANA